TESRVSEATPTDSSGLELFQRAFDAGQIGVWSWDLRSHQLTWSTKLDDFHGRPEGTSDGTVTIAPMDVAPQDATGVLAAIAKSLQTREPCRLEYRLPGRSEREERWFEALVTVIVEDGAVVQMLGMCRAANDRLGINRGVRGRRH